MGVSRRSCAAQRGVSEAAVRKAIATGRITTLPDGTIDPAQADSEWGAQTDPAKQRGQHAAKWEQKQQRALGQLLRDRDQAFSAGRDSPATQPSQSSGCRKFVEPAKPGITLRNDRGRYLGALQCNTGHYLRIRSGNARRARLERIGRTFDHHCRLLARCYLGPDRRVDRRSTWAAGPGSGLGFATFAVFMRLAAQM